MEKQTILDTPYATLWYYPEMQVIHHQFHKFIHGERFREVLLHGLSIFKEHGAQKWLSDDRSRSTLPQEDIDWANGFWGEPMLEAGWKYWAMIMPDSTVGKANMERIIEKYAAQGILVETFESPEQALEWFASLEHA